MKKLMILLTTIILVFGLVGCSSDPKPDIEKTVINYYTAIQEGDIEKANSYCTEEYIDALELSDINKMIDEQLSALNLGADFNNEAKNFMKNLLSQIIKKYAIEDIKVNGNEATAKVVLLSIDLEKFRF